MRSARLVAATVIAGTAAVAALAVAGFGAASAVTDSPAVISFTSPTSAGTVLNQAPLIVQGAVSIPGGFVDGITITVRWSDTATGRVPGPHPPSSVSIVPDVREAAAPWSFQPSTPYNGAYTVTVAATTDTGTGTTQEQTSASTSFIANLPPAPPTGIVAASNAAQRTTQLTWAANTEPDLVGYWIVRAGPAASDGGHMIGGVYAPQTSFTDDQVATEPPGSYRYEVLAVRQSGSGNALDVSQPSQEVADSFTTPAKAVAPSSPATTVAPGRPSTTVAGGHGAAGTSGSSPAAAGGAAQAASPPTAAPVLPPASDALPAYQALLNQAKQTTVTTAPPDPGFSANLPYQPDVTHKVITVPVVAPPAVLGPADQGTDGTRETIEFVAAALLLAVVAMFGLILKRSADQAGILEALAPAGTREPVDTREPVGLVPAPTPAEEPTTVTQPAPPARRPGLAARWAERAANVAATLAAEPAHEAAAPAAVVAALPVEAAPAVVTEPGGPFVPGVEAVPAAPEVPAAPAVVVRSTDREDGSESPLLSPLLLTLGGAVSDELLNERDEEPALVGAQAGLDRH